MLTEGDIYKNMLGQILSLENNDSLPKSSIGMMADVVGSVIKDYSLIKSTYDSKKFLESIENTKTYINKSDERFGLLSKLEHSPGSFLMVPVSLDTEPLSSTTNIESSESLEKAGGHAISLCVTKNSNDEFDVLVVNKGYRGDEVDRLELVTGIDKQKLENILEKYEVFSDGKRGGSVNEFYNELLKLGFNHKLDGVVHSIDQKQGNCLIINNYFALKVMAYLAQNGLKLGDLEPKDRLILGDDGKRRIKLLEGVIDEGNLPNIVKTLNGLRINFEGDPSEKGFVNDCLLYNYSYNTIFKLLIAAEVRNKLSNNPDKVEGGICELIETYLDIKQDTKEPREWIQSEFKKLEKEHGGAFGEEFEIDGLSKDPQLINRLKCELIKASNSLVDNYNKLIKESPDSTEIDTFDKQIDNINKVINHLEKLSPSTPQNSTAHDNISNVGLGAIKNDDRTKLQCDQSFRQGRII